VMKPQPKKAMWMGSRVDDISELEQRGVGSGRTTHVSSYATARACLPWLGTARRARD
jgi:hypothetical protein